METELPAAAGAGTPNSGGLPSTSRRPSPASQQGSRGRFGHQGQGRLPEGKIKDLLAVPDRREESTILEYFPRAAGDRGRHRFLFGLELIQTHCVRAVQDDLQDDPRLARGGSGAKATGHE